MPTARRGRWIAIATVMALAVPAIAQPPEGVSRASVARLIGELDSDRFEIRSRAERELESLVVRPDAAELLAGEFSRAVQAPGVSFEVRIRLRAWLKRLPAIEVETAPAPQEVDQLLKDALSNSFSARSSATDRLAILARAPRSATRLTIQLRERLADSALATADYDRLLSLYERSRGAWLMSDPAAWQMPAATEQEINRAVEQLAQPAPKASQGIWRPHAAARRQLLDLLCQDELVPQLKAALQTRLASAALDDAARDRLKEVLEWTAPALVAEIWQNRHQIAEQHLLVDVARQSLNATRPSHFSRIDDRTATCVSGQNLTPGEYPVGLAIAHPERPAWMCHLVNVPTPRRRMRYAYDVQRDEQQRLGELTERTLRTYTADRAYLSDLQILLLQELDPATVSRLIGDYFLAVDDRREEAGAYNLGGINVSHHGRVCYVLSLLGTQAAAPRLLEALQKQRFLPPRGGEAPFDWPWIAALAIAERDPWSEADAWLASLLDRREPLIVGRDVDGENRDAADGKAANAPELGATAAAMLLDRHDKAPEMFGLLPYNTSVLRNVGCPAYRYASPTSRQEVIRWWEMHRKQATQHEKSP